MEISNQTDYPIFESNDIIDFIYQNKIECFNDILCTDKDIEIKKFNQHSEKFDLNKLNIFTELICDKATLDSHLQDIWFMPDSYKDLNLRDYCLQKCSNEIEVERVNYELKIYNKKSLQNLLRYMIFLKDMATENNILLGVGRGSSVASFVLYLIGIHKVDPIKYNLNFDEFLN